MTVDVDTVCAILVPIGLVLGLVWVVILVWRELRLNKMIRRAVSADDPDVALALLDDELAKATRQRWRTGAQLILHNQALTYSRFGDMDGAVRAFERAYEEAKHVGEFGVRIATLNDTVNMYWHFESWPEAIEAQSRVMALQPWWRMDRPTRAQNQVKLAILYRESGDPQGAIDLCSWPLKVFGGWRHRRARGRVLAYAASAHFDLGQMDKALDALGESLSLALKTKEYSDACTALCWMGDVYTKVGQLELAQASWQQALENSLRQKDMRMVAMCQGGLGDVLSKMGRSNQAREHLEAAAEAYAELGDMTNAEAARQMVETSGTKS